VPDTTSVAKPSSPESYSNDATCSQADVSEAATLSPCSSVGLWATVGEATGDSARAGFGDRDDGSHRGAGNDSAACEALRSSKPACACSTTATGNLNVSVQAGARLPADRPGNRRLTRTRTAR
jgi:hypothetical protein